MELWGWEVVGSSRRYRAVKGAGIVTRTVGIARYHRGSSLVALVRIVAIETVEEIAHQKGHTME